jgi:hypothetical protein
MRKKAQFHDFPHLLTNVIDATLGASGIWLRTYTGADGTATLT